MGNATSSIGNDRHKPKRRYEMQICKHTQQSNKYATNCMSTICIDEQSPDGQEFDVLSYLFLNI